MLTSRLIMKTTLLIAFYITLTKAMYTISSKNFLNNIDKVTSLANETDSKVDENISRFSMSAMNIDSKEYTPTLVRKARQADSSDALNKAINNFKTQITSFSDTIKKGNVPANGGSSFVRPTSNSKFTLLESEMKKMKEEIQQMKSSSALSSTYILQLDSVEEAIEELQKLCDDKNRELITQVDTLESNIDRLTGAVNDFRRELNQIKVYIDESKKSDSKNALPAQIIEEIKSRNFDSAYEKLNSLHDPNKINYIVHEIYNNNDGNFDLILQFGDSIRFIEKCFGVYKALYHEMEYNNHDNPFKLVKLIDSLEKEVIKQIATSSVFKQEAQTLNIKIKSLLKDVLVRKMKEALKNKNYNETVLEVSDRIFLTQPDLFNEAIIQVTHDNFNEVGAANFVGHFESHKYIAQTIYGYSAVFNELRSRGSSNDKVIVTIAFGLKYLTTLSNYPQVRFGARYLASKVKLLMSLSLRNLAFSSRVCIKNIDRNEYLYAAGDGYKSDDARRRVLTWVEGTSVNQGHWIIERDGDIFYIKNYSHNEYLYAANNDHKYDEQRRNVYTWIPRDRVTQGKWTFELNGDNVYIKNDEHNEYLFADMERKLDSGRRHVFTWIPRAKTPDSQWKVENCG